MSDTFKVGCSGSGDLITADELFEILILILPEVEVIKRAFLKWTTLSEQLKAAIEARLEHLAISSTVTSSSLKDLNMHKGYAMSRILLRVFREWNHIQDTLGAPGIQSGFNALPKRLEHDISFMIRCTQEVFDSLLPYQHDTRSQFLTNHKPSQPEIPSQIHKEVRSGRSNNVRTSVSDTALSAGDTGCGIQLPPLISQTAEAGSIIDDFETESEEDCEEDMESDTGIESGDYSDEENHDLEACPVRTTYAPLFTFPTTSPTAVKDSYVNETVRCQQRQYPK